MRNGRSRGFGAAFRCRVVVLFVGAVASTLVSAVEIFLLPKAGVECIRLEVGSDPCLPVNGRSSLTF